MKKRSLQSIAADYFDYLGRHIPQQCASDEFYFLPRSQAALHHLNRLDDLAAERIEGHIEYVRNLSGEILQDRKSDVEGEIDGLVLKQSMESFVREFQDAEVWRNDPTLYIKIPLFATDQAISNMHGSREEARANLQGILSQIPSFLATGAGNLNPPSKIALEVALDMTRDALLFYDQDIRAYIEQKMGSDRELIARNMAVMEAWERYGRELLQLSAKNAFALGEEGLGKIFSTSLSYGKTLDEILEIARETYQKTEEKLHALAGRIDGQKKWKHIIREQNTSVSSRAGLLKLYKEEVKKLRRFFHAQEVVSFPRGEKVTVLKTPSYLRSLRATASYKAPLTGNDKGHGIFYITPGEEDLAMISSHCPYLSAHETYPGHHILDHLRMHHANPIRRQIESPLFYEGWACYGEQLLDELGYIEDPRQKLIGLKRQQWRNLRTVLDIELHTGKMTPAQAAGEIQALGFSPARSQRQIRRFCLTPGYQSCYFLGTYEIMGLRKRFSSLMGLRDFHDALLGGGEIPFHLVERRLRAGVDKEK
ncbi:MAG: DUF885 domain-containing protein [Deltaproteobacteria bacterium]|nr:DUF885 domain-containing protein [Deltaproteobacteria bacterium]